MKHSSFLSSHSFVCVQVNDQRYARSSAAVCRVRVKSMKRLSFTASDVASQTPALLLVPCVRTPAHGQAPSQACCATSCAQNLFRFLPALQSHRHLPRSLPTTPWRSTHVRLMQRRCRYVTRCLTLTGALARSLPRRRCAAPVALTLLQHAVPHRQRAGNLRA